MKIYREWLLIALYLFCCWVLFSPQSHTAPAPFKFTRTRIVSSKDVVGTWVFQFTPTSVWYLTLNNNQSYFAVIGPDSCWLGKWSLRNGEITVSEYQMSSGGNKNHSTFILQANKTLSGVVSVFLDGREGFRKK